MFGRTAWSNRAGCADKYAEGAAKCEGAPVEICRFRFRFGSSDMEAGKVSVYRHTLCRILVGLIAAASFVLAAPRSATAGEDHLKTIQAIVVPELLKNESASDAVARVAPIFAVANLYLQPIGVRARVIASEPRAAIEGATTFELLRNLSTEWSQREEQRNIVIAFTNGVRNDGSLGVAMPMTACRTAQAVASIAYSGGSQAEVERAGKTLAHELGHFLGASHDARSTDEHGLFSIMHPLALAITSGFSTVSRTEIEEFTEAGRLGGSCFTSEPVNSGFPQIVGPAAVELLPGESSTSYTVEGSTEDVWLHLESLDGGVNFFPATGKLVVSPGSSAAKSGSELHLSLVAETYFAKSELPITIRIKGEPVSPRPEPEATNVLRLGKKRKVSAKIDLRIAGSKKTVVRCSKAPRGVKLKVKKGIATFSGKLAKDVDPSTVSVQCAASLDTLRSSAPNLTRFLFSN